MLFELSFVQMYPIDLFFPILSLEFRECEFIICYKNNTSMSHYFRGTSLWSLTIYLFHWKGNAKIECKWCLSPCTRTYLSKSLITVSLSLPFFVHNSEHSNIEGFKCLFAVNGFSKIHLQSGFPPISLVRAQHTPNMAAAWFNYSVMFLHFDCRWKSPRYLFSVISKASMWWIEIGQDAPDLLRKSLYLMSS